MDFGKAIKQIRKEKNIKQKDLAKIVGLSVNGLCQIEIGNTMPKKETINKIAKALDVPVSYFFFLSLTEDDVAEDKRQLFNVLKNSLSELILDASKY